MPSVLTRQAVAASGSEQSHSRKAVALTAAGRVAFVFLWLFVLSFPAEKAIEIPGLGTISKLFGFVALGAGMLAVVIDGRIRVLTLAHGLLALFVLWTALTFRWSLAPDDTSARIQTYLQLFGMAWLIWEFCATEEHLASLMQAYVFGTFYAEYDTVSRYLMARQTYYLRYAGAGFDPNDLALTLALSLPLAYFLAVRSKGVLSWIYWLQMGFALMAILLSASRTGLMASCVALAVVPLTFGTLRRGQRRLIMAGLTAAVMAALTLIPAASWARLSTIGDEVSTGTLNSREMIWKAGLAVFREHPFQGVGGGAYPRSVEPYLGWPKNWLIVAHNTFFSVLVETGVAGFTLFSAFLVLLATKIARMPGLMRIAFALMFAVWCVGVNALSWEMRKPTWLLFALVLAASRVAQVPEAKRQTSGAHAWLPVKAFDTREVALP
jgi:O-antigen ligase